MARDLLALASIALVAWGFAACGGSTSDTSSGTGGATGGSTSGGGSGGGATGGSGGTTVMGGAAGTGGGIPLGGAGGIYFDASTSDVVLAEAGWFDCGGCACDGSKQYCVYASGGALGPPPAPDAAICDDSGTAYGGCTALPSACPSPPTCACLQLPFSACTCSDDGGGLVVKCYFP